MRRVLIMGAAGRDFHNFNTFFKDNPNYRVIAFTATQIPNITDRRYPKELAGGFYPDGIPIYPESQLEEIIEREKIDVVVFSYSDVSFSYVMERASRVLSSGADFWLLGPGSTALKSKRKVVGVGAVRTGCGKSQTTRRVGEILRKKGINFCVVRHPMPYGDLTRQRVQRFDKLEDLDKYGCTIEEREEYEPHLRRGTTLFAGVDYEEILKQAEEEFDLILWDGGNNDFPFYKPDLLIVVTDPLRAGDENSYYPGNTVLRMADVVVINKMDSAKSEDVKRLRENIRRANPTTEIIEAESVISVSEPGDIKDKRVLVIEDGPTLTHGNMKIGAGWVAAKRFGAKEIIKPKEYAVGSIKEAFQNYPQIEEVLPALGYGKEQIEELNKTIERIDCDSVIIATPVDLTRIIDFKRPSVRVSYELKEITRPGLEEVIEKFCKGN